jgi:hypothetical protein
MKLPRANKAELARKGIQIGLPILAIGAGALIVRKLFKGKTGTSAPSLKNMAIDKKNLTISPSDAALYANTLYGAMLNWGTNEKAIYSTIGKISTKDDMLLVIKAFGMKKYLLGGRSAFLGQDINLLGWLRKELGKSEIKKITPKFQSWGIPL